MGIKNEGDSKMILIVCDTGPILHLFEAKLLELLQKMGEIYIPKMVDDELNSLISYWEKERPEWIVVSHLLPDEIAQAESLFLGGLLDFGEAEAIILAKEIDADYALIDDGT